MNDAVAKLATQSPQCLTPLGQTVLADGFPASIEYLDNESPVAIGSKTFNAPLNPKVRYHSIIASKQGIHVDKSTMTDGVVSYNSAHLKGVTSETIIDGDHDLHKTEVVIDRIIKILSR